MTGRGKAEKYFFSVRSTKEKRRCCLSSAPRTVIDWRVRKTENTHFLWQKRATLAFPVEAVTVRVYFVILVFWLGYKTMLAVVRFFTPFSSFTIIVKKRDESLCGNGREKVLGSITKGKWEEFSLAKCFFYMKWSSEWKWKGFTWVYNHHSFHFVSPGMLREKVSWWSVQECC